MLLVVLGLPMVCDRGWVGCLCRVCFVLGGVVGVLSDCL